MIIKGRYPGIKSAHSGDLFTAKDPSISPLESFDQGHWAACAHTCAYLIWRTQRPELALNALNDESFLHELLHLASGVEISSHNSLKKIREEIVELIKISYEHIPDTL